MAFRSRYFVDRETQLNLVFSFMVMVFIIAVITFSNFTYFAIYFKEYVLSEPEAAGLNSNHRFRDCYFQGTPVSSLCDRHYYSVRDGRADLPPASPDRSISSGAGFPFI